MDIRELSERAMAIREKYSILEKGKYGRSWNNEEILIGFVGDVGDLAKIVMAKEGIREKQEVDEKLRHELSDCLWSLLVLANKYGIDIERSFLETMNEIEEKIK